MEAKTSFLPLMIGAVIGPNLAAPAAGVPGAPPALPGPAVPGEADLGGLPWWLLKTRDARLRTRQPAFMVATRTASTRLIRQPHPLGRCAGSPWMALTPG